jgi:hypothetical protein
MTISVTGLASELAHGHLVARGMEDDSGHVVAHEQKSSSTGPLQVFQLERIWYIVDIESGTFIFDGNFEQVVNNAVSDPYVLVRVQLVAVLDGVDQCFFQGKSDSKDLSLAKPPRLAPNIRDTNVERFKEPRLLCVSRRRECVAWAAHAHLKTLAAPPVLPSEC